MFREVYKQANEDIKGDRAILDKAFLKAAQPEKKTGRVWKCSFAGAAAAAVFIMGALFINTDVLNEKTKGYSFGEMETENVGDVVQNEEVVSYVANELQDENAEEQKTHSGARMSGRLIERSDEEVKDENEDGSVVGYSLTNEHDSMVSRGVGGVEECDDSYAYESSFPEAKSVVIDATEGEIEAFSYMYDVTNKNGMSENFINTDSYPIETKEDAIVRAEREYAGEYNSAEVYRDSVEKIWKVTFDGEDEYVCVYMTYDGVTVFISTEEK